jgi:uncharacterized membrane protein (DUF4010 family)
MMTPATPFSPTEVATKIGVSVGIGLLVGLEREWAHKDLGVRTFAITALLGVLSSLAGLPFALASIAGVFIVIVYVNWRTMLAERGLETTTSVALLVTYILGVLAGQGHLFTPVASAVVLMAMLSWKTELRRFAGGLSIGEIRSAVLLGLLAFVIYPILPNHFVDRWNLVNPREAWIIVVVIASIGFVNYVLLRIYGTRGLYWSGFLAGLVNSTAAASELAGPIGRGQTSPDVGTAALLLTVVAMFARNLLILAIFAPSAAPTAAMPLLAMAIAALVVVRRARVRATNSEAELRIESPVSMKYVFSFAVLFLTIQIVSVLGERHFGNFGFLGISLLGGLVSSASTSAAAAKVAGHGEISASLAGTGVVLASFASAVVNLPIIHRRAKDPVLSRRLTIYTAGLIVIGIAMLVLGHSLRLFERIS